MDVKTYEALKNVVTKTQELLHAKYSKRKRLNYDETWEKDTLIRDIVAVEIWLDEVVNHYED